MRPLLLDAYRLCNRFLHHSWRELEPGVERCRYCRCLQFTDATNRQLGRYLLGLER
jgi:hypothetical protein